jgi:hypothetical protein
MRSALVLSVSHWLLYLTVRFQVFPLVVLYFRLSMLLFLSTVCRLYPVIIVHFLSFLFTVCRSDSIFYVFLVWVIIITVSLALKTESDNKYQNPMPRATRSATLHVGLFVHFRVISNGLEAR